MMLSFNDKPGIDVDATLRIGGDRIPYLIGDQRKFLGLAEGLHADYWVLVTAAESHLETFANRLSGQLARFARTEIITIPDGERSKSLETVRHICERAHHIGATRSSVILSIGGGGVCNVGGLCASLLFRGIRLVQVPTTLMAMTDVVLSTKHGVNLMDGKNIVGTYYPPTLIWADLSMLETLPAKEIRAASAELVKNVLVISPEDAEPLRELFDSGIRRVEAGAGFLRMALASKSRVLKDDPRERREGLVLEYGHTVGHALEMMSGGLISHGYGVGLGMRVAARVAGRLGLMAGPDIDLHDDLLAAAGVPLTIPAELAPAVTADGLAAQLLLDNKRGYLPVSGEEVPMVLLTAPAKPVYTEGVPLLSVPITTVVGVTMSTLL